MEVSEESVEGALEPIHSTEQDSGADPKAGGLVQISMDFNRIASIIRELLFAVIATTAKFSRFTRVIVFVDPAVFKNRNLCFARIVGVN